MSLKIDQFDGGLETEVNERDMEINKSTVSVGLQGFTKGELGTLGGTKVYGSALPSDTGGDQVAGFTTGVGQYYSNEEYQMDPGIDAGITSGCEGYGLFSFSHDKNLDYSPSATDNSNFIFASYNGDIYAFDPTAEDSVSITGVTCDGTSSSPITLTSTGDPFYESAYPGGWETGQYVILKGFSSGAGSELAHDTSHSGTIKYTVFKITRTDTNNIALTDTLQSDYGAHAGGGAAVNASAKVIRRFKKLVRTGISTHKTFYYLADGSLRICDATNADYPLWYGYINRARWYDASGSGLAPETYTINRWYSDEAYPVAPLHVGVHMQNAAAASLTYPSCNTTAGHLTVGIRADEDTTGALGWDDSSGPTAGWKVGASFIYDDNQESEITESSVTAALPTANYNSHDISLWCTIFDGDGGVISLTDSTVTPSGTWSAGTGTGVTTTALKGSGSGLTVNTSISSGDIAIVINADGAGYEKGDLVKVVDPNGSGKYVVLEIGATNRINSRVTGFRVYLRENSGTDFSKDYYYMGEFDLKDGGKKPFDQEYSGWISGTNYQLNAKTTGYSSPSKAMTYTALNGRSYLDNGKAKFKTAAVANRRCYIGNVKHTPRGASSEQAFEDRLMKSVVNNFDIFPPGNYVDVAVNDGDKITFLAEYANKLLQFKRRKLYVINVSGDSEFLESSHDFMGVREQYQVVRYPNGVAWCNRNNVYIYDGKAPSIISGSITNDYQSFYTNGTSIGFDANKNALVLNKDVRLDAVNNKTNFVYDFRTQSWAKSADVMKKWTGTSFSGDTIQSNFINDFTGKLIFLQESSGGQGQFRHWHTDPLKSIRHSSTDAVHWESKDIDFGAPGQRKNIYKVRITYKIGGTGCTSGIAPYYAINGSSTFNSFVYTNGSGYWFNLNSGTLEMPVTSGEWSSIDLYPAEATPASGSSDTPTGYQTSKALIDIDSIKLKLGYKTAYIGDSFAINDITIYYRLKGER